MDLKLKFELLVEDVTSGPLLKFERVAFTGTKKKILAELWFSLVSFPDPYRELGTRINARKVPVGSGNLC
jgi:hypothetical protein